MRLADAGRHSVVLGIGVSILHAIAQFLAWSWVPGNTPDIRWAWQRQTAWDVLSVPVFAFPTPEAHFWFLFLLNSALWGVAAWVAAVRLAQRRSL